jgi:hypothetical protein
MPVNPQVADRVAVAEEFPWLGSSTMLIEWCGTKNGGVETVGMPPWDAVTVGTKNVGIENPEDCLRCE